MVRQEADDEAGRWFNKGHPEAVPRGERGDGGLSPGPGEVWARGGVPDEGEEHMRGMATRWWRRSRQGSATGASQMATEGGT